jgi:hypothetical protein
MQYPKICAHSYEKQAILGWHCTSGDTQRLAVSFGKGTNRLEKCYFMEASLREPVTR